MCIFDLPRCTASRTLHTAGPSPDPNRTKTRRSARSDDDTLAARRRSIFGRCHQALQRERVDRQRSPRLWRPKPLHPLPSGCGADSLCRARLGFPLGRLKLFALRCEEPHGKGCRLRTQDDRCGRLTTSPIRRRVLWRRPFITWIEKGQGSFPRRSSCPSPCASKKNSASDKKTSVFSP